MRIITWPILALVAAAGTFSAAAQDRPAARGRVFQSGIDITSVAATVRDESGALVTGLTKDDFQIYEDGEPQSISQFTSERVPVSLGLLLDTSDSMHGQRLVDARAAVTRFLLELLDSADEFFLMAFNHEPRILNAWTSVPAGVRQMLDGLNAGGSTAVYDAVMAALPLFDRRGRQRAALVVISDGADTASTITLRELRTALVRSDAFAYAIALDPPATPALNVRVNPQALRELTDQSGGRTEVIRNSTELADATARIAEELNHQYLLGYSPGHGADGKYHTIRVRARNGTYQVRARNGYVATPGPLIASPR